MEATARQLLQPVVGFSDASMQPQNGVWSAQNHTLFQPARFDRWYVVLSLTEFSLPFLTSLFRSQARHGRSYPSHSLLLSLSDVLYRLQFDQERFFTVKEAQNAVIGLVAACEDLGTSLFPPSTSPPPISPPRSAGIKFGNHQPEIHYAPRGVDIPSYVRNLGGKMVEEEGGPPELLLCFLPRQRIDAYVSLFLLFRPSLRFRPELTPSSRSQVRRDQTLRRRDDGSGDAVPRASFFSPLLRLLVVLTSTSPERDEGQEG